MAEGTLAVLLRNGTHSNSASDRAKVRLGLKCENIAINMGRTPIQVPIPSNKPELIDLGIVRPTISISGLVDSLGGNPSNTTDNDSGSDSTGEAFTVGDKYMAHFDYTFNHDGNDTLRYYIPYKNFLEEFCAEVMYSDDTPLEIQIGDPTVPIASNSAGSTTGGAIYKVAIQSANFTQTPAMEDRWQFAMQFVAKTANHVH